MDKETQYTLASMDAKYIVNVIMLNRELVTALEAIRRALGNEGHEPNREHALEIARAAIAKAEGGQQ